MPYQYTHALVAQGAAETSCVPGEEKVCCELLGVDTGRTNLQIVIDCVAVATCTTVKSRIVLRVRREKVTGTIIGKCEVINASAEAKNTMVVMGVDNLAEVSNQKYLVTMEVVGEEAVATMHEPVLQAQW